jgi:hypothetical protein
MWGQLRLLVLGLARSQVALTMMIPVVDGHPEEAPTAVTTINNISS